MSETVQRKTWNVDELIEFCQHQPPEDRGNGNMVYRGFIMLDDGYWLQARLHKDFVFYESWSKEPYLMVWVHTDMRAILTYCEGDVTLSVHVPRSTAYFEEYRTAEQFYRENR